MKNALYLGWHYLVHHRAKSTILIAAVSTMLFLPAATNMIVSHSAVELTARAEATPLVLGARGGDLELVLATLYFQRELPVRMDYAAFEAFQETELADAIPLHTSFNARGATIVGTTPDYFRLRKLKISSGRQLGLLGECIIGARVASRLDIAPGNTIISSPETVLDLAGTYPLKLNVVGVLESSRSADDDAVFVDIRTVWIIAGLGHGHQDLAAGGEGALSRQDDLVTANLALRHYNEITPENVASFHFHGDASRYPLTGAIVVPSDEKSSALLRGRYEDHDSLHLVEPRDVINDLLETVFSFEDYVLFGFALLGSATLAVVILVLLLSYQLRRNEFRTLIRMGASRQFVVIVAASEAMFVVATSVILAAVMTIALTRLTASILKAMLST